MYNKVTRRLIHVSRPRLAHRAIISSNSNRPREPGRVIGAKCNRLAVLIAEKFRGKMTADSIVDHIEAVVKRAQRSQVPDEEIISRLDLWINQIDERRRDFSRQHAALNALRNHISAHPDLPFGFLRRFSSWVTDHWAFASTTFALVAATIVRVAYNTYYSEFGLTPEEAGVDSTRMLIGSVPGILLFVLLASMIVALAFLPALSVLEGRTARLFHGVSGHQSRRDLVWFLVCTVVVCIVAVLLAESHYDYLSKLFPGNNVVSNSVGSELREPHIFVLEGTLVAVAIAFRKQRMGLRPYVVFSARSYLTGVVSVMPTVLMIMLLALPNVAEGQARSVRGGQDLRPATVLGRIPLLDIRVTRVTIEQWPLKTLPPTGCYFVIGTGETTTIIYDVHGKKSYRLPKGQLVLSAAENQSRC
jgi:hypothetical protein